MTKIKQSSLSLALSLVFTALLSSCRYVNVITPKPLPTPQLTSELTIKISQSKQGGSYYSYEPIFIDVSMKNISKKPLIGFFSIGLYIEPYRVTATREGIVLPGTSFSKKSFEIAKKRVNSGITNWATPIQPNDMQPGKTLDERIVLQKYIDLSMRGNATINVTIQRFGVTSNVLKVKINDVPFDMSHLLKSSELTKKGRYKPFVVYETERFGGEY